jgi:hypothetical protein
MLAVVVVASIVVLVYGLKVLATDVYVPIEGNDPGPAFCGSAYDVTFMKKDGYMGGEYPVNQAEIDAACRDKAAPYSHRGLALAVTGAAALGLTASALLIRRRHTRAVPVP